MATNGAPPPDELATIPSRIVARLIDWLILFAFLAVISVTNATQDDDGTFTLPVWAAVLGIVIVLVWEAGFVAARGQTPGKRLVGIEIVSVATAARPSLAQSVLRVAPVGAAMALLGSWFPVAMVFVYFTAGFMAEYRGLLDKIAGTAVIRARSGTGLLGQTGSVDRLR